MNWKNIFLSKEGNLRTIVKLLSFVFLFQFIGIILLKAFVPLFRNDEFYLSFLVNVLSLLAVVFGLLLYTRFIEKRSIGDYGIAFNKPFANNFLLGLLLGYLLISFSLIFQYQSISFAYAPESTLTDHSFGAVVFTQFVRYLSGSFFEELLATAFLFNLLVESPKQSSRIYLAILLSGLLFGAIHAGNENATLIGLVNLTLFGAYTTSNFALTRSLGLAVGFHAMWNFTQNIIFGMPNSGQDALVWIYKTNFSSSDWWSGGSFGIEGSLIISLMLSCLLSESVWQLQKKIKKQTAT